MSDPADTALLPWEELDEGPLDSRSVFAVRTDRVRSQKTGKTLDVDRLVVPDWVNVIALTERDGVPHLLLVRQYRFGVREFSLELPAGVVDPGEDLRAAALRELREETGHVPANDDDVVLLGEVWPNAAFMNNRMVAYFVPVTVEAHALALDEHEELEVITMPLAEVEAAVRDGAFKNAAVVCAFALAWSRGLMRAD